MFQTSDCKHNWNKGKNRNSQQRTSLSCFDEPISQKAQAATTHTVWFNLNSSVTIKKIKFVILKWKLNPDGFTGEFYQMLAEFTLFLHNLCQEVQDEGTLPNSFYETSINHVTKSDKDITKKESYRPVLSPYKYRCKKFLTKCKYNLAIYNKIYTVARWALFHGCKVGSIFENQPV